MKSYGHEQPRMDYTQAFRQIGRVAALALFFFRMIGIFGYAGFGAVVFLLVALAFGRAESPSQQAARAHSFCISSPGDCDKTSSSA